MPADKPKGAEAVEAMLASLEERHAIFSNPPMPHADGWRIVIRDALRADPLRAYIREQMERVECRWCWHGISDLGRRCSVCGGERTVPRYQAEGGAEAFIAGLEARL